MALALSVTLAGIAGTALPAAAQAQTAPAQQHFSIPAGTLREVLDALASQSGITVLYSTELVAGKNSRGLSGRFTSTEALRRLLQDTGLEAQDAGDSTFTLRQAPAPRAEPSPARTAPTTAQPPEPEVRDLGKITVTGTRIRGGTTASPVITIGAEQIREEGFTDLGEVIRSIPQNYAGGQNPGVTTGGSLGTSANTNFTGGSALNLRGLGPNATLTLLNGRRLAYDGAFQAVDISAIPVEAVERIEVVTDGASAIYGSDAVGGVANVIVKRDFDGVAVGARYGVATEGGLDTREYTATAGTTWSGGGLIATWKKLSSDPISTDQRDYTASMYEPSTLYPGLKSNSGLVSSYQSLGEVAELRLDALKTDREQETYSGYSGFYYFSVYETSVSLVSPSIEIFLPHDWSVTLGGTYGKDEAVIKPMYVTSTGSTLSGWDCYCNESRSYEASAEGPLFPVGGGDARLAVGVGSRTDDFENFSYLSATGYEGDESSRYAYAELNLPFVSPDSTLAGIHRLAFSAAIRSEDYDSYGRVTTPKLGLIYAPSTDFTLKASWGKSFKAPTLYERYQTKAAYLYSASSNGGSGYASDATVLASGGGSEDLKPERARTWTTSLALHPEALPALEAELTWFNIDYTDRVVTPISNWGQVLSNPAYAEFIDYTPTAEEQAALLAIYNARFTNYSGADYDPDKVVAIVSGQYTNAARQRIKGLDLSGSYRFEFGDSRLTVRGSASRLNSSQKNSAGQNYYDLAGTIFRPAKYKSRLGAVWAQGGFNTSIFVNYTSGVTSELTTMTEKTASFMTVDATLRYDTGARGGLLSDLAFELSAQNLFNRDPPFYTVTSIYYPPYDSTNYSAIGRFLSVSVSKRW